MATFSGTEVSRGVPNSATAVASLGDYLVAFRGYTGITADNVFTVLHVPSGNVRMFTGLNAAGSIPDGVVGAAGRVWTTRRPTGSSTRSLWSVDPVTGEVFGFHGTCGELAVWVGGRVWTGGAGSVGPRGWSPTTEDWVNAATTFGAIGAYDGRLFGRSSPSEVVELNPSTGAVVATYPTASTGTRSTRGATIGDDIWWPSTSTAVDMHRFNVTTGQLHSVNATPPGMPTLTTIVAGPDGNIWSLVNDEIVVFNPDTLQWASGPVPSTRTPWAALTFHDGSPWLISSDPETE